MRVLIESPNCNAFGGSNAGVGYGWVTRLARDHEVHVVVYDDAWDRGGAPEVPGVRVVRVRRSAAAKLGTMSDFVIGARRMRDRLIGEIKPDVVHSVEPGGWGGPRALATTRAPYVLGPVAGGAVEHPRAFSAEVLEALPVTPARALFSGGPKRFAVRMWNEALFGNIPTTRLLGHAAMRKARLILTATRLSRGAVPASCESKVRRIPLAGIDLDAFRPAPKPDGDLTVLYAGRVVAIKCLHLLIEAAARAGVSVRVAGAAGAGEEWYERYCRERAAALGARVTWLGHLPRAGLAMEYARADLFCMLSLWDTYGLTYAEAMACGTPVVALAAGGPAEIVTPEVGWLVQPTTLAGAVEQLTERLEAAAADRAELRAMGAAARAHAERTYDWDRLVAAMNAYYDEVA